MEVFALFSGLALANLIAAIYLRSQILAMMGFADRIFNDDLDIPLPIAGQLFAIALPITLAIAHRLTLQWTLFLFFFGLGMLLYVPPYLFYRRAEAHGRRQKNS